MRKKSKCFQPYKNLGEKKGYFSFLSGSLPIHALYFCNPVLLPKKPRKIWRALWPKLSMYSSRRGSSAHKTSTGCCMKRTAIIQTIPVTGKKVGPKHEESDALFFLNTSCIYTRRQRRRKLFMCPGTDIYISTCPLIRTVKKVQETKWV